MNHLLPLIREHRILEKKNAQEGMTPLEYQRWVDLSRRLESQLRRGEAPAGVERRAHPRLPIRMLAQFSTCDALRNAVIRNISHGGLFLNTPFAAEIGVEFTLCLRVDESGDAIDIPCVVVSNNVADGFTTAALGMGVRFKELDGKQREAIDRLFEVALDSRE